MQGRLYNISNSSRLNNGTGYSDEKPGPEALNEHLLSKMDRSLDEIIAERPVRTHCPDLQWIAS